MSCFLFYHFWHAWSTCIYMNACPCDTCMCGFMCMDVHVEARGWHWVSSSATLHFVYWGRVFHWIQSSWIGQSNQPAYSEIPSLGLQNGLHPTQISCVAKGSKLWSSQWQSQGFSDWAICPSTLCTHILLPSWRLRLFLRPEPFSSVSQLLLLGSFPVTSLPVGMYIYAALWLEMPECCWRMKCLWI